ncbi:hypothetical protein KSP40_PGU004463 [Platanthera guangdongensis]|uniref:Uncharacterized protein n=1 Tax=Platanthera guangdongensis TaxID=2320717 RepID=A0ABR2LTT2_9ASPA
MSLSSPLSVNLRVYERSLNHSDAPERDSSHCPSCFSQFQLLRPLSSCCAYSSSGNRPKEAAINCSKEAVVYGAAVTYGKARRRDD